MVVVTRRRLALLISAVVVLTFLVVLRIHSHKRPAQPSPYIDPPSPASTAVPGQQGTGPSSDLAPTHVYAHNLMLRKGPTFRIYVRWLRGLMTRAKRNVNPTFDDPDSFFLDVKTGVLRANIGDISNYLNEGGLAGSPLKNIKLSGDGNQIKLTGTLHKIVPLPIELIGNIAAVPDNLIQIHVTKLNVLKIPFKAVLGGLNISVSDLFSPKDISGIRVSGNDIFLDTQKLLPPPHIRGQLTNVRVVNPDLEEVYGNAERDVERVEQWRNFLRLSGGTIDFGKLTMRHVDLIMIDISKDVWFDLDLNHYQEQLVNGYTRMTPQAGLQIFMPDLSQIPHSKATQNISMEWLKNRNIPPPDEITSR
jgi:hypothetical protein